MSDYNRLNSQELDRHITGNYGEDQFKDYEVDGPESDPEFGVDWQQEYQAECKVNQRLRNELNDAKAEVARLRQLKTLDDSPLLQSINEAEAQIITLQEQKEKLLTTLKELADLAEIRTTPHEHVPGIGNAVARARILIREVEGE